MPPGVKTIRIWELRLINVKSYSDETLRFQPGINFISGINGAGKTTIIESIGYALFNYNPYSLRHFLREGAKSGEIQVLLEALDERLYRIVRKFNSRASTKWEVWDEESDTVLDELHGAEDVSLWIKRSIGLGDSDNLPDLFSQVIAVEQGLFTAPFLDTVTSRRQTFDRILKVEGYRQAFQRSSSIESHFANTQKLVAQEITFLETMLRPLPELEEKITRGLEKLQAEKQALLLEQARVKELAVQVQQFHEKRDQIRDLEKDYALIQTEISSGRQQIEIIAKDLDASEQAAAVCSQTETAYRRYLQNQAHLRELEQQLAESRKLEQRLNDMDKYLSTTAEGLKTEEASLKNQQKTLGQRKQELEQSLKSHEIQVDHFQSLLNQLANWQKAAEPGRSLIDKISRALDEVSAHASDLKNTGQRAGDLEAELRSLASEVQSLPEMLENHGRLEKEINLDQIRDELTQVRAEREALVRNADYLTRGICPIIQEPCPSESVQGGLDEYFQSKRNSLEKAVTELEQELDRRQKLQKEADKIWEKIIGLQSKAQNLETKEGQLEKLYEEAKASLLPSMVISASALFQEDAADFLAELDQTSDKIVSWFSRHELEWGRGELKLGLGSSLELPDFQVEDIQDIAAYLKAVGTWYSNAQRDTKYLGEICTAWEQWFSRSQQFLQSKLQHHQVNVQSLQQQLRSCGLDLDKLADSQRDLENRWSAVAEQRKEYDRLKHDMEKYQGLDIAVEKLKEAVNQDEVHAASYRENVQLAAKVPELREGLAGAQRRLANLEEQEKITAQSLADLEAQFDASSLAKLEVDLQTKREDLRVLEFKLQDLEGDLQEWSNQRDILLSKQTEYEVKLQELAVTEKAQVITALVRRVLRQAAEPIAQQFRRYVSQIATEIYRQVSNESVRVEWAAEYEVQLIDYHGGEERVRVFKQLSGGEQMTAALAVRLAIMRLISKAGVGFFDEPTTNLDGQRRGSLAQAIQSSTTNFHQLFVISHDDAFDSLTENTIALAKDGGQGTKVLSDG